MTMASPCLSHKTPSLEIQTHSPRVIIPPNTRLIHKTPVPKALLWAATPSRGPAIVLM